jgi:hypothetical protein
MPPRASTWTSDDELAEDAVNEVTELPKRPTTFNPPVDERADGVMEPTIRLWVNPVPDVAFTPSSTTKGDSDATRAEPDIALANPPSVLGRKLLMRVAGMRLEKATGLKNE